MDQDPEAPSQQQSGFTQRGSLGQRVLLGVSSLTNDSSWTTCWCPGATVVKELFITSKNTFEDFLPPFCSADP